MYTYFSYSCNLWIIKTFVSSTLTCLSYSRCCTCCPRLKITSYVVTDIHLSLLLWIVLLFGKYFDHLIWEMSTRFQCCWLCESAIKFELLANDYIAFNLSCNGQMSSFYGCIYYCNNLLFWKKLLSDVVLNLRT